VYLSVSSLGGCACPVHTASAEKYVTVCLQMFVNSRHQEGGRLTFRRSGPRKRPIVRDPSIIRSSYRNAGKNGWFSLSFIGSVAALMLSRVLSAAVIDEGSESGSYGQTVHLTYPSGSTFIFSRWFTGHSSRAVIGLSNPRQALCISGFRCSMCADGTFRSDPLPPKLGRYSCGMRLITSLFMFLQSVSFPPPAFFWT